ncbi:MAG: hypothetical protein JW737_03335 [Acidobacteria bacterium]|nr:hypothetical protein [Acidobacteriota bacterium]
MKKNKIAVLILLSLTLPVFILLADTGYSVKELIPMEIIIGDKPGPGLKNTPFFMIKNFAVNEAGEFFLMGDPGRAITRHDRDGKCTGTIDIDEYIGGFIPSGYTRQIAFGEGSMLYLVSNEPDTIIAFGILNRSIGLFFLRARPSSVEPMGKKIAVSFEGFDQDGNIINILNSQGKVERRIHGGLLADLKRESYYFKNSITSDENGNIYQSFNYFPFIRKYNAKGQLFYQKEIDLSRLGVDVARFWNDYDFKNPSNRTEGGWVQFSRKVQYYKGRLYLLLFDAVLELSLDGKLLEVYQLKNSDPDSWITLVDMNIDPAIGGFFILFEKGDQTGIGYFSKGLENEK